MTLNDLKSHVYFNLLTFMDLQFTEHNFIPFLLAVFSLLYLKFLTTEITLVLP